MGGRSVGWRTRPAEYPQERLVLGELHLVRRRLDEALLGVVHVLASTDQVEEWKRVEEAARIGSRALAAAVAAIPPGLILLPSATEIQVGELRIDTNLGRQWYGEQEFELTPLLHQLLAYMAKDPYRVIPKEELAREIWGHRVSVSTNAINAAIKKLGRALADISQRPRKDWMINLQSVGWALTRPPTPSNDTR